jgi:hypothetical protein
MSKFCTLQVNAELGEITVIQTVKTFVAAIEKASQEITSSIKGNIPMTDMCVAVVFADAEVDAFNFCTVSPITNEMFGNLPQVRLNASQTAMQFCADGEMFNDMWLEFGNNLRTMMGRDDALADKHISMVFNARTHTVSFQIT